MAFKIEKVIVPKKRNRAHTLRELRVELFKSSDFPRHKRSGGVCDHEGNKFQTIKAMCEFWGVNYHTYRYRRSKRLTLELALTLPTQ